MQEMKEKQIGSLGWEDPPGGRNGNPIQYSCLGNPMDRGAQWATDHGGHMDMTERLTLALSQINRISGRDKCQEEK